MSIAQPACSIPDCEKPTLKRGWCNAHYLRWWKHGDPLYVPPRRYPETCTIEGCGKPYRANGLCVAHWTRMKRYGDVHFVTPTPSVEERFRARVEKTPSCWNWTGFVREDGYGLFGFDGRNVYAHRFSYEFHKGPIPAALMIDHLCRNRRCVNPQHLETVTNQENVIRGVIARNAERGDTASFWGEEGLRKA